MKTCTNYNRPVPGLTRLSLDLSGFELPFQQIGEQLSGSLDIGGALNGNVGNVPEAATSMVLASIGRDLLIFLAASVVVTPLSLVLNITPILGYLIIGGLLGPHGFDIFANSKADLELGDFGILFLLFSEGLEVSSVRLQKLANYFPLALAQISLTTASLTAAILLGLAEFMERFLPLDGDMINVHNPPEAVVLALAGTLSTSAFIFPVLKERGWEEEESGQAATSILLLQDLFVAPLLVLLPYVVGQGVGDGGPSDYSAIAFLTFKATVGFGSVFVAGSFLLRRVFKLVAQTKSTETFVALCLLVSVGMGTVAKDLGLTDTAGAFAAGILLANTNYRAQIQADILPFKGILLGIFFMVAGSSFDLDLAIAEWPTVLTGSVFLIVLKAATLALATRVPRWLEPNRLSAVDGIRVSLLLSGGGEFAFVVLALAEKLGVLPVDLGGLLTAIVLITMGVTPLLGQLAEVVSERFVSTSSSTPTKQKNGEAQSEEIADDAIVVCGYNEVGQSLLKVLGDEFGKSKDENVYVPRVVAFETDPSLIDSCLAPNPGTVVLFGDASNPVVIRSSGVNHPSALFIAYEEPARVLSATFRLRASFADANIYARAQTRAEAVTLKSAGATEVVVELDELSRSALSLIRGKLQVSMSPDLRMAAAQAAGVTIDAVDHLLELYTCMDRDDSGLIDAAEFAYVVRMSNAGIVSDDELDGMEGWLRTAMPEPIDPIEFCRIYMLAPKELQSALDGACVI
eukprot:CAMPEP_0198291252 /NCGR_PEP_ID=MMETSP1449-20131203/8840_1 /TAXON_ID=420275 /ORGANISM="Attheya septentrionalis, Strain CCMP2084" /LENGTH=743 /DNA_ID=CAMNT_0043989869 /DNA_START=335 /DNA_END=2566 /DNA_ORIENTATION=-